MKTGKAFIAGVIGGAVMTIIMAVARAMGMQVNLELMLGTMFGIAPSIGAWVLGLIMHLIISGLIAIAYGFGFERLLHRAGVAGGLMLSVVHILIGGVVMGFVPAMHPLIPDTLSAPGPFMANLGILGVVAFVMLHMIYGAIVGALYGHVIPRRETGHAYT